MMARHDKKTSAGRAKMLSGGDTGDRLAEVNKVLGGLVVQTVEHHEAELEVITLPGGTCWHPIAAG